ncbi:hypothetical protein PUMCH_002768 [Australozyma saopauloensis]|uniref:Peroxin 20 n=1 Tax=Australozyma saopauloensis TaxID=291208 RepID=A0AAX4HA56_9ASCO|nr:hypothetical protein PUMCH_002768 [[Candida] saopauloensis]
MDASCGPSSALSQLLKHTQRDNSLQHEAIRPGVPLNAGPVFRNQPGTDAALNRDFHQFSQGTDYNTFQAAPTQFLADRTGRPGHAHPPAMNMQAPNQQWVQDFNGLSLNQSGPQSQLNHNGQPLTLNWSLQFMQHAKQNHMGQTGHLSQMGQQGTTYMQQPMMFNQAHLQMQQMEQVPQMQPLQNQVAEMDPNAFEAQFDQISRELEDVEQPQIHSKDDTEKERFAEAARKVQSHMTSSSPLISTETATKFQQSNFLKLMSQISNREVEVSDDGAKLVAKESGADVRDYLSDPLKDVREADQGSSVNMAPAMPQVQPTQPAEGTITNESAHVRSHLPDPLAHIRDGELLGDFSALQAARVISGGQVNRDDWMEDLSWEPREPTRPRRGLLNPAEQEVYDDYRNDDDFH